MLLQLLPMMMLWRMNVSTSTRMTSRRESHVNYAILGCPGDVRHEKI
jgi:hypothetical protein